jgi:septum formation protein
LIVLASGSSVRRRLLAKAGVVFRVHAADIDESPRDGEGLIDRARRLAREKALAVPGDVVIGSDQVGLTEDQRELRKPWSREEARAQLASMSGRAHTFVSAAAIVKQGAVVAEVEDRATVRFHELADDEIERYLDLEEWRGSAGAYHLEGHGARLVAALEGHECAVYGLPLFGVLGALRGL